MGRLPQGLLPRLVLTALAALGAIVGLELWLRGSEEDVAVAATVRERGAGGAGAAGSAWAAVGEPDVPDRTVVPGLDVVADAIALSHGSALHGQLADAAPVVRVLPGGGIAVVRPAPLPAHPGRQTVPLAAVQLPVRALGALDAGSRTSLLDALAALLPDERPPDASRIRRLDVTCDPAELEALLSWLR